MTVRMIKPYVWESHMKPFSPKVLETNESDMVCLVVSDNRSTSFNLEALGALWSLSISTRTKQPFRLILYKRYTIYFFMKYHATLTAC